MLKLENIGITFNPGTSDENIALKNINLEIQKGDFITVIGSNGAGKSTLYNVISGTLQPSCGHIFLNSQEITKQPEYKRAAVCSSKSRISGFERTVISRVRA